MANLAVGGGGGWRRGPQYRSFAALLCIAMFDRCFFYALTFEIIHPFGGILLEDMVMSHCVFLHRLSCYWPIQAAQFFTKRHCSRCWCRECFSKQQNPLSVFPPGTKYSLQRHSSWPCKWQTDLERKSQNGKAKL